MTGTPSIRDLVRELLASQPFAVLASQSQGQPYCNLVAFAVTPSLDRLLFPTSRNTRKFANLAADGRVSFLIDNRTNQPADLQNATALTLLGTTAELDPSAHPELVTLFLQRHPTLREFVLSPNCAIMTVAIETGYLVRQFQSVQEFRP